MPKPKEIKKPRQLVVEGRSAEIFFKAFLGHEGIDDVQIQDFGGVTQFRDFLEGLLFTTGFPEQVVSLAVVRDAEGRPAVDARRSVEGALAAAGLAADGGPRTAVFILPDDQSDGMLETLCLRTVSGDPALECVDEYLDCLAGRGLSPRNEHKSRLQAFLASREEPGLLLGQAADRGYWDWTSPELADLRDFLKRF